MHAHVRANVCVNKIAEKAYNTKKRINNHHMIIVANVTIKHTHTQTMTHTHTHTHPRAYT